MATTSAQAVQDRGEADRKLRDDFGWTPYRLLAGFTLASCAAVILIDFAMWFIVDGYNPLGQTISELAAGPHAWIQDSGIVIFVLGLLSLEAALVLRGTGSTQSWILRGAIGILAIDIALIAVWNEYGDGEPGGLEIHMILLAILYPLVAASLWFASEVKPAEGHSWTPFVKGAAAAWLILAPLFFVVPDGLDGGYERILALFMVGSVAAAAYPIFKRPRVKS